MRLLLGMQDVHKSVGRRRLMADPVPDANAQQQAQQGAAAQASPIFAEEAGQIEPRRTRGRSVIPRAPGTSPSGTQQADSAPGLKGVGASPIPNAPIQQGASGAGVIDTCALACCRPVEVAASMLEMMRVLSTAVHMLEGQHNSTLAAPQFDQRNWGTSLRVVFCRCTSRWRLRKCHKFLVSSNEAGLPAGRADESVTEAAAEEVSEEGADTFAELFDEDTEGNVAEVCLRLSQRACLPELSAYQAVGVHTSDS